MDFRRHVTAGPVSELFGAGPGRNRHVPAHDGLAPGGRAGVALLPPDDQGAWRRTPRASTRGCRERRRHASGAKSPGVQHPRPAELDYLIEQWNPVDSLAWLKAMAWDLRGNMEDEIRRAALLARGLTRTGGRALPGVPVRPQRADRDRRRGRRRRLRRQRRHPPSSRSPMTCLAPGRAGAGCSRRRRSAALPGLMGNGGRRHRLQLVGDQRPAHRAPASRSSPTTRT